MYVIFYIIIKVNIQPTQHRMFNGQVLSFMGCQVSQQYKFNIMLFVCFVWYVLMRFVQVCIVEIILHVYVLFVFVDFSMLCLIAFLYLLSHIHLKNIICCCFRLSHFFSSLYASFLLLSVLSDRISLCMRYSLQDLSGQFAYAS